MAEFIWEREQWPELRWDADLVSRALGKARHAQGLIAGAYSLLGAKNRQEGQLAAVTREALDTADIEGEQFDPASVRSSVARRLGIESALLLPEDRRIEGLVEVVMDAMGNWRGPMTIERLLAWHRSLFPYGGRGRDRIVVGAWRDDAQGPMRVLSGPMGREREHFRGPPADRLQEEMDAFIGWFNGPELPDPLIMAALAPLRFLTIHPFDDGNGRIARALAELWISRAEGGSERFYSVSSRIRRNRASYYEVLERCQRGTGDVTEWLVWFLEAVEGAISQSRLELENLFRVAAFWRSLDSQQLNPRQRAMIDRLLNGFEGRLTSSKWAALQRCSQDSANRDINDLMERGILRCGEGGGRSTWYELVQDFPISG